MLPGGNGRGKAGLDDPSHCAPTIDKKKLPRIVDVVAPTYQPSKTELEEDMRVRATFEEAVEALTRVKVRYIPRPRVRALLKVAGLMLRIPKYSNATPPRKAAVNHHMPSLK